MQSIHKIILYIVFSILKKKRKKERKYNRSPRIYIQRSSSIRSDITARRTTNSWFCCTINTVTGVTAGTRNFSLALASGKAIAPDSRWALSRAKFSSYVQRQYVWRLAGHLAYLFFFYVDRRGNGDSYRARRIARDIFNVSGIYRLLGAKEHNSITRSDERLIGLDLSRAKWVVWATKKYTSSSLLFRQLSWWQWDNGITSRKVPPQTLYKPH